MATKTIDDIFTGLNTKLFHGVAGAKADAITSEVTDCTVMPKLGGERNIIEVPTFGQKYGRKRLGQGSIGNIDLSINWKPEDPAHKAIEDAYENGTKLAFKMVYSDEKGGTATRVFDAYVASFFIDAPLDGITNATSSLAVDGGIKRA